MIYALITLHVLICFFLIIVVLLQSGKAADLAGAFGGMGSQTAFGPRGAATVLSKATTIAAVLFMITSITLTIIETRRGNIGSSVLERQKSGAKSAPVTPARPAPGGETPVQPGQPVQVDVTPPPAPPAGKQEHAPAGHTPAPGHSDQHAPAPGHSTPAAPGKK